MNHDLLSMGSKRRRTGGSVRGNASSNQVDEEQMNRVLEEEQHRHQEGAHVARNGDRVSPLHHERPDPPQERVEENNNRFISVDDDGPTGNREDEGEHACGEEEEEEEEEMDQDSDNFEHSEDSGREDAHTNGDCLANSKTTMSLPIHQQPPLSYTKTKT